ncbi:MAG: threonine/serine dehydratase [Actinomycetota bacterium]|nr:threonine/serine dehydratase [Actinomycetota bacterium]
MDLSPPTIDDVRQAWSLVRGLVLRTPLIESPDLSDRVGRRVLLKLETLQRTGSFKYRGAMTFLSMMTEEARARGVVAYSSGNHAQAVAAAAAHFGVSAIIVMPSDAPEMKARRTREWGAEIVEYDRATDDRAAISAGIAHRTGAAIIPPYEHPWTIAGQGTTGLELAEQCRAVDVLDPVVLVPTGGGGLTAGIALALSADLPDARVHTVEPVDFDDYARSLATGERVGIAQPTGSICDALLAPMPGEISFAINRRLVAGAETVTDDEVRVAIAYAFEDLKLVVEPGGSVGLALLLAGRAPGTGPCVAVLSGGNVDPVMLLSK